MKSFPCYLCQSNTPQVLVEQKFQDNYLSLISEQYQQASRQLVTCGNCGFVYRSPSLTSEDLDTLYEKFRDTSTQSESPDQYFDRITQLPDSQSENHQKLLWLSQHLEALRQQTTGKILDIGCGGGVFLHKFLQWYPQWTPSGVEPTPSFAQLAKRRLQCPIYEGMYQSHDLKGPFDLICMMQVLEHVLDPVAFLKQVYADLSNSGFVYIEVPDISDFQSLPPEHDRFHAQHLYIYSQPTLEYIASQANLEVVAYQVDATVRNKQNLSMLLRKSQQKDKVELSSPLQNPQALLSQTQHWRT